MLLLFTTYSFLLLPDKDDTNLKDDELVFADSFTVSAYLVVKFKKEFTFLLAEELDVIFFDNEVFDDEEEEEVFFAVEDDFVLFVVFFAVVDLFNVIFF